ncbi:hypothetical protein D3C73_959860 [compost metagenome]
MQGPITQVASPLKTDFQQYTRMSALRGTLLCIVALKVALIIVIPTELHLTERFLFMVGEVCTAPSKTVAHTLMYTETMLKKFFTTGVTV